MAGEIVEEFSMQELHIMFQAVQVAQIKGGDARAVADLLDKLFDRLQPDAEAADQGD